MNNHPSTPIVFSIFLTLLPACSSQQARQAIETRQKEMMLNTEAWHVARGRLKAMCPDPPKNIQEYQRGKGTTKVGGEEPFKGCDIRIIKLTNAPLIDDWQWDWLPPYMTIIAVHEEELRKRVVPKVYEEYVGGLARYLAEKADKGEITPQQLVFTFNEAWKWLFAQVQQEAILLQQNLQAAQQSDAAVWNALGTVAAGMATVATTALVTSAAAAAYRPAPVNCIATRAGLHVVVTCH